MPPPLAFLGKLIRPPQLSTPQPGIIRASMPFLKLLGNRSGSICVRPHTPGPGNETGVVERWMEVVTRLLPSLTTIRYTTATGTVDLMYDEEPGSMALTEPEVAARMTGAVEHLAQVALEFVGQFLAMGRESLWTTREMLIAALDNSPVDMREAGSEERLRELLRAVCD